MFGRQFSSSHGTLLFNIFRNFHNSERLPSWIVTIKEENGELSEAAISEACDEIEKLYDFTQRKLISDGCVHNGKVRLVRSLRRFETCEVAPQLKQGKDNGHE